MRVPFDKAQLDDALRIDPEGELAARRRRSTTTTALPTRGVAPTAACRKGRREADFGDRARSPVGRDVSGPTTDDDALRGGAPCRCGQARARPRRLRKYVVTEHVQRTVPVRREECAWSASRSPRRTSTRRSPALRLRGRTRGRPARGGAGRREVVVPNMGPDEQGDRDRRGAGLGGGPQGADRDRGGVTPSLCVTT